MDLIPLKVKANCILSDEGLYEHIRLALERELPLLLGGGIALVGSGPSVKGQIESIRKARERGVPVVAIKDAHDWLISEGLIPDFAVAADPQEHRWNCFRRKHKDVQYLIASQCHPAMFEHLKDMNVKVWHLYIHEGQTYPPNSMLVTGGTTTGMRCINLFYAQGFRSFDLYGFDSCLSSGTLRIDGTKPTSQEVEVTCGGKKFVTTPEMAAQANEFQMLFTVMPDIAVRAFGEGLIATILDERKKLMENDSASFIHSGNASMASFRYRCRTPSQHLGIPMNNYRAKIVIFSKPTPQDFQFARSIKADGRKIVFDICDDHLDQPHYAELLKIADVVTCPTLEMGRRIEKVSDKPIWIIPDPYEFPLAEPHCKGVNLLWFGHGTNYHSLQRILPELEGYPLRVVSNVPGSIPWSEEIMPSEFAKADIVILPATAAYKSPNRAVEAIRQGCFVVAEPHPSLKDIPGIYVGNIKEGIEWARQNPQSANEGTKQAQEWVESLAPARTANVWRMLLKELGSTSDAEEKSGPDGSMSMDSEIPMSDPICEFSPSTMATQT